MRSVQRRLLSSLTAPEHPRNLFSWHHRDVTLEGAGPRVSNLAYVAPSATLAGNVEVWDFASVGYEAAVRGDVKLVRIGAYAHLQDGVTVSEAFGPLDDTHDGRTIVGHYVTVGPNSVLRACTIEPECVVGAGCSLLEGSYMAKHSILEAGSVLQPGQKVPSGQVWAGSPAAYVRDVTEAEAEGIKARAEALHESALRHKAELDVTPFAMDTVWEVEKLGFGHLIGYHERKD